MEELKECGLSIEYVPINVLREDDEIINAIRWLLKQII